MLVLVLVLWLLLLLHLLHSFLGVPTSMSNGRSAAAKGGVDVGEERHCVEGQGGHALRLSPTQARRTRPTFIHVTVHPHPASRFGHPKLPKGFSGPRQQATVKRGRDGAPTA